MDVIRGYRITPEPTTHRDTYTCNYCGGERTSKSNRPHPEYCNDCRPLARELGWLQPKKEAA